MRLENELEINMGNTQTTRAVKDSIGKTIRKQFIAGLLIVLPLGASILILVWIFNSVDHILKPTIEAIFNRDLPGVGFGVTIILIYLAGIVARNVIGYKILQYFDNILKKVPVFNLFYRSIRQITNSFSSMDNSTFLQVVLVDFPQKGMKAMAFVTNEIIGPDGKKSYTVLIPTAPNPTSGFMQIVKDEDVVHTKVSVDEAIKMVLSVGKVMPNDIQTKI
jgi:uncharacterized membrane protein